MLHFICCNTSNRNLHGASSNEASDMTRFLFSSFDPYLIRYILDSAGSWSSHANPDLFRVVWKYISDMACTKLGKRNPISIVCRIITSLELHLDIYEKAFQLMISKSEQSFALDHQETLDIRKAYLEVLRDCGELDKAERLQRQSLSYHKSLDGCSSESVGASVLLGQILLKRRDFVEAENIFRDALQCCRIMSGEDLPSFDFCILLWMVCRIALLSKENSLKANDYWRKHWRNAWKM